MSIINAINPLNYRSVVSFNFDKITNQELWDIRIINFYNDLIKYPIDKKFIGIRVNINEDSEFMIKLNVDDINFDKINKFYQNCCKFINLKSFYYEYLEKIYHFKGDTNINININNIIVPIQPNSFIQANHQMGNILYKEIMNIIKPNEKLIVYGRNSYHIASQIYKNFKEILCINPCEIANSDGLQLIRLHNFFWSTIKSKIALIDHINSSDENTTIIISPGRGGYCYFDQINKEKFRNKQFIYITCNEESFIKNIKKDFNIKNNIMIELFPGTKFNEHIVELELI